MTSAPQPVPTSSAFIMPNVDRRPQEGEARGSLARVLIVSTLVMAILGGCSERKDGEPSGLASASPTASTPAAAVARCLIPSDARCEEVAAADADALKKECADQGGKVEVGESCPTDSFRDFPHMGVCRNVTLSTGPKSRSVHWYRVRPEANGAEICEQLKGQWSPAK